MSPYNYSGRPTATAVALPLQQSTAAAPLQQPPFRRHFPYLHARLVLPATAMDPFPVSQRSASSLAPTMQEPEMSSQESRVSSQGSRDQTVDPSSPLLATSKFIWTRAANLLQDFEQELLDSELCELALDRAPLPRQRQVGKNPDQNALFESRYCDTEGLECVPTEGRDVAKIAQSLMPEGIRGQCLPTGVKDVAGLRLERAKRVVESVLKPNTVFKIGMGAPSTSVPIGVYSASVE